MNAPYVKGNVGTKAQSTTKLSVENAMNALKVREYVFTAAVKRR
jgi:hypothetical protein